MASWFYLTLWRGTPPEMTDHIDAVIETEDYIGVEVEQTITFNEILNSTDRFDATIENNTDDFTVEIVQKSEVEWIVRTDS